MRQLIHALRRRTIEFTRSRDSDYLHRRPSSLHMA
jgi:hypothetical protein